MYSKIVIGAIASIITFSVCRVIVGSIEHNRKVEDEERKNRRQDHLDALKRTEAHVNSMGAKQREPA